MGRFILLVVAGLTTLAGLSGSRAFAGGWASFEMKTPNHNILRYDGTGGMVAFWFGTPQPHEADGRPAFERFYFYRSHVVGLADDDFYVIDEKKRHVMHLSDREAFDEYLENNGLEPKIWTRWYDRSYDEANFRWLNFFALIMFPLTIVLALLYCYSLYSLLRRAGGRLLVLKKVYVGSLSIIIFIVFTMQVFPQSI